MTGRQRFFFIALTVILLLLATVVISHAEARVLPAGTVITWPDGHVETLTATAFLLTRDDMERATTAMAQAPVDVATILGLHDLSNKQQATINVDNTWKVIIGAGSFILGVLVDELVRR